MKYKNKIGAILLSICLLVPMFGMATQAASGSVSISSASGNVGSTVTVTCTVKSNGGAIAAADVNLTYPASKLTFVSGTQGATGGSGSVRCVLFNMDTNVSTLSFSMTFRIAEAGNHSITCGYVEAENLEDSVSLSLSKGSGTITGKAVTTGGGSGSGGSSSGSSSSGSSSSGGNSSSNTQKPADNKDSECKLKSLKVSPGSLSPAFNANTTDYTVTVPKDTTEVVIGATAKSSKATVSVSGGKDLKLGDNPAQVVVTAENGDTCVYSLNIVCGEVEKIDIDGAQNTINESFTDEYIPTGFSRTKVTYNDRQYEAVQNEALGLKLMSLQGEAGVRFYIYSEEDKSFYPFVQIEISKDKYVIAMPIKEGQTLSDCEQIKITLQECELDAWKWDEEFSVLPTINQDGAEVLYRYDSVDGTMQRYTDKVLPTVSDKVEVEKETILEQYSFVIICVLTALSLILLVTVICLLATRKENHSSRKKRYQKKQAKAVELNKNQQDITENE